MLGHLVGLFTHAFVIQIELKAAGGIGNGEKARLALNAFEHDATSQAHLDVFSL